jgi:divalent metal cation (Fe/Co/Zn/Cd) transporter
MYILDGIASILIGLILGVLALLLAIENRGLIIGRSAQYNVEQAIGDLAMKVRHVKDIHSLKTMYVGPRNLLVNMEVEVNPRMRVNQADEIIEDIENVIRHNLPIARHFSIEILADDQHKDWYTRDEIRKIRKRHLDYKQKVYRRKTTNKVE